MIYMIIYLVIALFISTVMLYAMMSSSSHEQDFPSRADKIGISIVFPILWPLSITAVFYFWMEEHYNHRKYMRAKDIMRGIGNDCTRIGELSMSDLKLVYIGYKHSHRLVADFSKIEQELLNRTVEENIL